MDYAYAVVTAWLVVGALAHGLQRGERGELLSGVVKFLQSGDSLKEPLWAAILPFPQPA